MKSIFFNEVSDVLHGFGDCEQPLRETVLLVEKILHQQWNAILAEAIDVASRRRGEIRLTQADFEYLMRRNPEKIYRLQKHLRDLGLRKRIQEMLSGRQGSLQDDADVSEKGNEREVAEKYDEEKSRRLFRADRISQILTGAQYQHYNSAKRTSFYCRHPMSQRFRSWLSIPSDLHVTPHVMTILSYLAHETIAVLVDRAILVRLNSSNRIVDPYQRYSHTGITHQMMHLCPDVTQGRGGDGIKPITVQEINEALRRIAFMSSQNVGRFRNTKPETPILAL